MAKYFSKIKVMRDGASIGSGSLKRGLPCLLFEEQKKTWGEFWRRGLPCIRLETNGEF